IPHRLDWGVLGQTAAGDPSRTFAFAMSGVLDPRVGGDGTMIMGPMGSTDTLRGLQIDGQAVGDATVSEWLSAVGDATLVDPFLRSSALARLAQIGEGPLNNLVSPSMSGRIAESLNAGARAFDPPTLGLVIAHLQANPGSPAYQPLLDAAARSDQADVRLAYLLGQANKPDHPSLDAAERSGDLWLRRFAAAYRVVLQDRQEADTSDSLLPLP
ncbi:unnamed protein product, partial [Ectocarpus fasciculatus]